MEAAEITSRPAQRRTLGPWFVYLTVMGVILFLYVRGWIFLQRYAGNIVAGLVQVSIPRQKLYLPIILSVAMVIAALLFRSQVAKLVNQIPLGLRGLLLPLPFYFIFTLNWSMTGLVLILGVFAWLFYESLARFLRLVLSPLPVALQVPLMRYWPAVLYTYLLTSRVLPTVVVAIGVMAFHLFDASMESYFAPVWDFHRTLTPVAGRAIFLTRLAVGATAPFVFSYSWGLFNPLMDRYTAVFAVLIFLITYFIMRGPRAAVRILIIGVLLGVGITDFAWADNCSGADDCYNTVGFNSAALAALFGGLAAIGLNWVLEAMDLKRIDQMTWWEKVALSLALDQIPIISNIKNFIDAMTWKDLITGAELSEAEWRWAVIGSILPLLLLGKAGKGAKAADKAADTARLLLDKASDLARAGDKVSDAARATARGGELSFAPKAVDRIKDLAGVTKAESGLTPAELVADAEKNFRMRAAEEKLPFNLKTINEVSGDLNCPDTSVAVEASLRGTPRAATTTSQILTNEEIEAVLGRTFESADSFVEIETKLENLGPGSRGIIRVEPMDGSMGHVYNVANIDGEVIWIDGQRGLASTNAADLAWDTHWVTDFMQTWPP